MDILELRQKIILHLQDYSESDPHVFAYWIGGSDANNESDIYSDLDLCFCVQDGKEDIFLKNTQKRLEILWVLDYVENIDYHEKKMGQTFHISGTPESLLIEIIIVLKSQWMLFTRWHPAFKPKIIFDRAWVITFKEADEIELWKKIQWYLTEQRNLMMESDRASKYARRKEYIETTNYYIKYVFLPLVAVLRVKYTPELYDWLRIHISRHFPQSVVDRLNFLMQFTNCEDILEKIPQARDWFSEIVSELDVRYK